MNRFATHITKLAVLVVALAAVGAGTATAAKLITGKQVKNRSLTGKDVKQASLGPGVLSAGAKQALKGPQGEPGATGAAGPQGERGPSTAYAKRVGTALPLTPNATTIVSFDVPKGSYTLQAKTVLGNNAANGGTPHCSVGVLRGDLYEALDDAGSQRVGALGSDTAVRAYSLLAFAVVDNVVNTVQLRCEPDDGQTLIASQSTVVATQVAELK